MDYISVIEKNIVIEDKDQVIIYKETGEDFKYCPKWKCFKCGKPFYTLEDFKTRVTTCPHCAQKHNTKIYKNGRLTQRIAL